MAAHLGVKLDILRLWPRAIVKEQLIRICFGGTNAINCGPSCFLLSPRHGFRACFSPIFLYFIDVEVHTNK